MLLTTFFVCVCTCVRAIEVRDIDESTVLPEPFAVTVEFTM